MSKSFERLTGVNRVRAIQVIEIVSLAGEGTTESPIYEVTEYYSLEGELLARRSYKTNLETGIWHDQSPATLLRQSKPKQAGGSDVKGE